MVYRRGTSTKRRSVRRRPVTRRRSYRRPVRRYTRRASTPNPRKEMTGTGHGDKYIKAFIDPFMADVDGVKIPDSNAQPSVPLKALDTWDVTADSTYGSMVYAFNPHLASAQVFATMASTTTWSWGTSFGQTNPSNKLTNLRNDQELFRPVAHAVRVTSGLAPTAATGFVHVCVFSQATYNQSTWTYPTSIAQMQNVPGYKRIPLGRLTSEGLLIVNRPMDVTAQRYVDTDSPYIGNAATMEFHTGLQWCSILVAVTGAPISSTSATCENVIHLECIPRANAISQSTPAAKYNVTALGGASNAASKARAAVLDSEKGIRASEVVQAAAQGIQASAGGAGMRISSLMRGLGKSDFSMRSAPAYGGIRNSAPSHSGML